MKIPYLIIFLICFIGTNSSPITPFNARIINGTYAPYSPWVARIITGYNVTTQSITSDCGGSLIGSQWILTAKHCIVDQNGKFTHQILAVSIGNNNYLEGSLYSVTNVYFPNDNGYTDDIALIKLINPVKSITPIAVQLNYNIHYDGLNATIYGWGVTESGYQQQYLQYANVTLQSRAQCQNERMICFNPQITQTNSCIGDSGGPMTILDDTNQSTLIGISHSVNVVVDWGSICSGFETLYMDTSYYGEWIQQIMNSK